MLTTPNTQVPQEGERAHEPTLDRVFWPGSIGGDDFRLNVEAAAAGGFDSLAIHPRTFLKARESGLSDADMRSVASDARVAVQHLDIVTNWVRPSREADRPPTLSRYDVSLDTCFEIADVFGLKTMNIIPAFYASTIPLAELSEHLGIVCDRALKHGVWVDLEFMPFWGVPDLATAWAVVSGADRPNSGILVDTWHFCRSGSDLALIDAIPGKYLASVQIADGPLKPAADDLYEETKSFRRFVDEGELPNDTILRRIAGRGHLRHVGAEVFSIEAAALDAAEAGRRLGAGLDAVLQRTFRAQA